MSEIAKSDSPEVIFQVAVDRLERSHSDASETEELFNAAVDATDALYQGDAPKVFAVRAELASMAVPKLAEAGAQQRAEVVTALQADWQKTAKMLSGEQESQSVRDTTRGSRKS